MKLYVKLLCAILALASCFSFVACNNTQSGNNGENSQTEDVTTDPSTVEDPNAYKVTVLDYTGAPYPDVIVSLYRGDEMLKMTVVDKNGNAFFDFEDGDYTFKIMTTDNQADAYYYDTEKCVLSATLKKVTVTLYNRALKGEKVYTGKTGDDGQFTYTLKAGCSAVELEAGINYFIFRPEKSGEYRFSANVGEIGYYGNPIAAMDINLADSDENGALKLSIKEGMLAGSFLFGVTVEEKCNALITLARIGDVELTWEDRPWTAYMPEKLPLKFTLPKGTELVDIDVTDPAVSVVYNKTDGYFHYGTPEGPIVYVRITTAGKYLAPFSEICENTRLGTYLYNDKGEIISKESYNELIELYKAACDENSGVIPLDRNMEYVIKTVGESWGWWKSTAGRYLFSGVKVVDDIAWLFACCYAK